MPLSTSTSLPMSLPGRVLAGLSLFFAAIFPAGCASYSASATRSDQLSAPVPAEGLVVEGKNGSVRVEAGDFDAVYIEAELKAFGITEEAAQIVLDETEVKLEESNGYLRVFAVYPDGFKGGVSFVLKTPPSVAVDLQTGNGSVSVDGIVRNVKVRTSNGSVSVKNAVGPIETNTSNGNIEIEVVEPAQVAAETSNGTIRFSGRLVGEDNRLKTSNGKVELKLGGEALNVSYKTSNGNVTVNGEKVEKSGSQTFGKQGSAGASQLTVTTSNGSISMESLND